MKKIIFSSFVCIILFFAISSAFAATFYVRPDGNDLNPGTENTPQGAWKTIQKAADTLKPGDTVEVQSGTYNESVLISISGESTKPIIFRANGEVIIDGQNTRAYCLKLQGVNFIKIEDFTLRNSTGAGILLDRANYNIITNNTSHNNLFQGIKLDNFSTYNTISKNTLYNNTGGSGALGNRNCGIYLYNSSNNNTIDNNTAYQNGTGIWLEGSSSNCTITNNKTYSNGWGGLLLAGGTNNNIVSNNLSYSNSAFGLEICYSANNNLIKNNTIYSNQTNGVQLNNSATNNIIKNNIITNNGLSSSSYYGIYIESGSSAQLSYNDIFNNGYGGNNKYGGVATGSNDISSDPLFKSTDPLNPDFLKLQSIAKGDLQDSPCIDSGDPTDTPNSESGQRIDIGAYDLYIQHPQATYYVKPDGNDLNDGRTIATTWATIQKAADTLNPGDIVEIQPGTYNEQINITRSGLSNQYITFRANGEVIIDGQNTRPYSIKLNGADYIKIKGLTLRNSTGTGILIDNNANYNIITNNICHNNPSTGIKLDHDSNYNTISKNILYNNDGGPGNWGNRNCGIYVFNVSDYNTIDSNVAYSNGTGIWFEGDSSNCTIINNKTYSNSYIGIIIVGGTNNNILSNNLIYSNASSGMHIGWSAKNNIIKNNTIYSNGWKGIMLDNATTNNIIKNNIVVNNTSDGVYIESGSSAQLSYNDFFGNGTNGIANYTGIATLGIGDISLNPYFKLEDPFSLDFLKLKSLSFGDPVESPCIDTGSPSDMPNQKTGRRTDIGAYDEYQHNPIQGGLLAEYFDNQDLTSLKLTKIDPRINFDWGSYTPDASIGVDTFSVRWQGQIKIDYAQNYTFYITTDDGSRLWIDNQLIIDKWFNQGPTEHSGTIYLTPGFHDIKYEYYENGGWAVAKLYWSSPSINKTLIPSDHLYYFGTLPQDNYVQGGLKGEYYKFNNLYGSTSYVFTRIDPQINFDWGSNSPDNALGYDSYSAKWKGKIKIDRADTYTFYTTTDDGVRLWVNNQVVIDAWWDQGAIERQSGLYLTPGLYDIELDYYENGSWAVCKLLWSSSIIAKSVIPPTNLYYEKYDYSVGGFYAEYFDNKDFTQPKIKRHDQNIDFDWISFSPDSYIEADTYSIRWTGQVKADYNETYTFYLNSDDGARLYIDNQLLIDIWFDRNPYEASTSINLTQGWHDIKIEYYENVGRATIKLACSSPSTPKTIIPQDHLRSNQHENIITSNLIYHLESREDIQNPTLGHSGTVIETGLGQLNFLLGKTDNAVELNGTSTDREGIKLSTSDLNKEEGTISFWFKPNWNSDDNQMHRILTTQWDWSGCLEIFKYHENNCLYFKIVKDGVQHAIVADSTRKWNAGEWHQLAFSWGPKGMKFYLDGNPIPIYWTFHDELPYTGPMPDNFASELYLGENNWGGESINAVVDELIISKVQDAPDVIAPTISIVFPLNNAIFTVPTCDVSGIVDDNNAIVTVNSVKAAVSNNAFVALQVPLIPGLNTITAQVIDKWGNKNEHSINIIYETTPPTQPIVTDDGDYTLSTTELHATWSSSDPETGIQEYQYSIGTALGLTNVLEWTLAGLATEATPQGLNLTPGTTYYFNIKAKNSVAMWSRVGSSDGITVRTNNPPAITNITPPSGSKFQAGQLIDIQITAQDPDGDALLYQFKIDGEVKQTWSSKSNYEWQTSSSDVGTHAVTCGVKDIFNTQTSQDVTYEIILDTTLPSGTITINNGAQYANSTQVTLTLSATDDVSGVDEMQFSNDGTNGTNWSTPEPYSTTKPWDLSAGDGTKTVYAKFKDKAGNWSGPVSDTITLDITAPTVAITSPLDGYISNTQPITVSGTIDDNQAQVNINGIQTQVSNGTFAAEGVTLNLGQNTITAIATDLAGNTSQDSITVTYQPSTALSIDITSPQGGARVNTSTITVSGTVSDNTASVTVNGISAQVTNYTFTVSGITLTEGTNIITATATKDTQTAQDTINVILDQDPPSINIYVPDANSTTRSNIVYGRVSDDTQSVTVNGTAAELLSDFRFIARPILNEGLNTITVQATDLASNSNQASINITYNTTTPKVVITSPLDNSEIDISPIKVHGTNAPDLQFILVNTQTAIINDNLFAAEGVILDTIKTVITASGYDANNNVFSDSIVITSPQLSHYELQKVSGDIDEADPNRPQAGSDQTLIVKLNKNNLPAPAEEIQFNINQGNGTLSYNSIFTDINGEAQVTLTTDTDSDITNQVECYPSSNPLVKTTFYVDTKPAAPYSLTKITDDSITPVPGATIDLIVKLTDQNQNPIPNEIINFQVISGDGTLSSSTATTTYYGEAKVNLTCPNLGLTLTQIQASSQTVPSVIATFNITTSAPLTVTVQDIIDKVNYNDSKIQDIKADITVTSNAPFLPPTMQLKIWQKRDKQKVEEISPNPRVKIRPISSQILQMNREIILCNSSTNIYVIKSKLIGQADEYPYDLDYVDYQRGIVVKTERHFKVQQDIENLYVVEYLDFLQFNDIWGFQKIKETMYDGNFKKEYYIIKEYSNIQINAGIPDTEFN